MRRSLFLLVVLLCAFACASPTSPELPPGAIRVTGTVHYYTFEGGFWAVRGDDGATYDPMNGLPPAFQSENLRVLMVAKVKSDLGGVHMAGPIVEVIQFQRL